MFLLPGTRQVRGLITPGRSGYSFLSVPANSGYVCLAGFKLTPPVSHKSLRFQPVQDFAEHCPGFDFQILATDISTRVLEKLG